MLRTPSQLLTDTFRFHKLHFYRLSLLVLIQSIIAVVFGVVVVASYLVFENALPVALFVIPVALASVAISIISTIALVMYISNPTAYVNIKTALRSATPYFWSFLWIGLLVGIFTLLGFLALFIPGVVMAVWFTFTSYVLIVENKRGLENLKTSRNYVRGNWFKVFGRLVILMALYILVTIFVSVLASILAGGDEGAAYTLVSNVLSLLLGIVATPFSFIYFYFIYTDLKSLKNSNVIQPVA